MLYVLIHSPILDPSTMKPLARALEKIGHTVIVPSLPNSRSASGSYCDSHADAAAQEINACSHDENPVLVGYSASGVLLPLIGSISTKRIAAYLFVDSDIPQDGASRLDLLLATFPAAHASVKTLLQEGDSYPTWSDEDLRDEIVDSELRSRLIKAIRAQEIDFYSEPIPVQRDWPDAPCGYLQLSETYSAAADEAYEMQWQVRQLSTHHFLLLTDPNKTAMEIQALITDMALDIQ